jgi:hypothetical protein
MSRSTLSVPHTTKNQLKPMFHIRPGRLALWDAPVDFRYGQAQYTLKNLCIAAIPEAEAACMLESVRMLIDATDNLAFQETINGS